MTGKARIMAALAGDLSLGPAVALDYLDLYLAERREQAYVAAYRERLASEGHVRLDPDEDVAIRAQAARQAYACFSEPQDWFYIGSGPSRAALAHRELRQEEDGVYEVDLLTGARRRMLLGGHEASTLAMLAHGYVTAPRRSGDARAAGQPVKSRNALEPKRDEDFALARALVQAAGDAFFLYAGASAPFWHLFGVLGFEGMMQALAEGQRLLFQIMDHALETTLARAQAFRDLGVHGIRVEECLASADIISEATYEQYALPYEEKLLAQLRRMGFKTILYFCGDVMPRLPSLRQLPIDGLMVEESKKGFTIDIAAVRAAVGPGLCLMGNIDSYGVIQQGTDIELRHEIERQIRVAGAGAGFITAAGSPLTLDTPPQRVNLLVRLAREAGRARS